MRHAGPPHCRLTCKSLVASAALRSCRMEASDSRAFFRSCHATWHTGMHVEGQGVS